MLRFYLDEHVPNAVANGLRRRQIDVKTTADAEQMGATDRQQLDFAILESRVLFTNDADFLRLAAEGIDHPGIVYCHPSAGDIGDVIRLLSLLNDSLVPEDMQNKIEFL